MLGEGETLVPTPPLLADVYRGLQFRPRAHGWSSFENTEVLDGNGLLRQPMEFCLHVHPCGPGALARPAGKLTTHGVTPSSRSSFRFLQIRILPGVSSEIDVAYRGKGGQFL